ncbi:MAG: hypothetical protein IJX88_01310 [Clostridia bacterium]|nr:hypothetical protein [Clostridia bacterium]
MRFFTEEWYRAYRQSTFCGKFLQVYEKVAKFDEALFLRLYKRQERLYIRGLRACTAAEEQAKELGNIESRLATLPDGLEQELFALAYQKTTQIFEEENAYRAKCLALAPVELQKAFAGYFEENLKTVGLLPATLLQGVADKRVLALGYATREAQRAICNFAESKREEQEAIFWEAEEAGENVRARLGFDLGRYIQGDLSVIEQTAAGVCLEFDGGASLLFEDGEILRRDGEPYPCLRGKEPLCASTEVLGFEQEYTDGKYYVSILLENKSKYGALTPWELCICGGEIRIE